MQLDLVHRAAFAVVLCVSAASCAKPQLPQVTAKAARITNVSVQGIDIEADLLAYNPNDVDLDIQGASAKVLLDKRYDLGTFTDNQPVKLPARKSTLVKVPIKVRWADMMGLAELATSGHDIDYMVEGDVELGGEFLRVRVPFTTHGVVTHQQLLQAAGRALPGGIPHIPGVTP